MARRRVVDWRKAAQKYRMKPWPVKLTWFGILGSVDDFGLCVWSPLGIGQVFMEKEINERKLSIASIERIMESFTQGADPEIAAWEFDGQRYLAVRKHQDYQHVQMPGNADCPCPPQAVLQRLSDKTRDLIMNNLQKFTSYSPTDLQKTLPLSGGQHFCEVEVEVERRLKGKEVEDESMQAATLACSSSENGQHHKACMDCYHEEFQKLTGEKPRITAKEGALLKQTLAGYKEGDTWQKVRAVICYGVSHRDVWIQGNPPSLAVILSTTVFNSILGKLALAWKEKHA